MEFEKNLAILKQHLLAENEHDMEATLATLHPECLFEDRARMINYVGHKGAAEYYGLWWKAFDLIVVSEKRHRLDNNNIVSEARYQGRHQGSFVGEEPTGRRIDFPLVCFLTFRDGLLAGERTYYDLGSLLSQIGAREQAA
ncbi:ester cyclase [Rhodoligotrophos defluvii]|uniref:ester cyclase n=1 Tax=Rhodoligotrophos defluvii TaxID=2561934 RepID=UPI0010C94881|nr:ester cyclase [Rhodoligotrophos defluvii]